MGPHGNLERDVNELEVAALRHPLLAEAGIIDADFEVRVLDAIEVLAVPGRELGVGREGRACDVVGEEGRVRLNVPEGDDVVLADDVRGFVVGEDDGGFDNPVVVGVVERVRSDLLACISG